ncbi:MAG: hypothetical protein AB1640_23090 [bacterium]
MRIRAPALKLPVGPLSWERARHEVVRPLFEHRELLLLAVTLFICLYGIHGWVTEPQRRRLEGLEGRKAQLEEQLAQLTDAHRTKARSEGLRKEVASLKGEVQAAEQKLASLKPAGLPFGASPATLFKSITEPPLSSRWEVTGIEEVAGPALRAGAAAVKLTGEGTFPGLLGHLGRIEGLGAQASVRRVEIAASEQRTGLVRSSSQLEIAPGKPGPISAAPALQQLAAAPPAREARTPDVAEEAPARNPFLPADPFAAGLLPESTGPGGLELQAVLLHSNRPKALVSGEIVSPGDRILDYTVAEILKDRVCLTQGQVRHCLFLRLPFEAVQ